MILGEDAGAFNIGVSVFVGIFQLLASIWLYKDFVGWNKFESPEGFSIKRKKK
jgi:hypothetical protein